MSEENVELVHVKGTSSFVHAHEEGLCCEVVLRLDAAGIGPWAAGQCALAPTSIGDPAP